MILGDTVTAAAVAANVAREAVHRWFREDHHFRAAYNSCRRELFEASRTRLLVAATGAAENLAAAVHAGDRSVSVVVLKGLGVLDGKEPILGAESPAQLEREHLESHGHDEAIAELLRPKPWPTR